MKQDFIIDFETIGQNFLKCPVVDASYVVFDWHRFSENPYSFEELVDSVRTDKLSVEYQVNKFGNSFSKDDLRWWMNQPKESRDKIKPSTEDITVEKFSANLFAYLREVGKINHWWSRGNIFDGSLLERIMRELSQKQLLDEYLLWWRVRDTRTWIDAKFDFPKTNSFIPVADVDYWNKTFSGHVSSHDVSADILRLQAIFRAENDLEQVER